MGKEKIKVGKLYWDLHRSAKAPKRVKALLILRDGVVGEDIWGGDIAIYPREDLCDTFEEAKEDLLWRVGMIKQRLQAEIKSLKESEGEWLQAAKEVRKWRGENKTGYLWMVEGWPRSSNYRPVQVKVLMPIDWRLAVEAPEGPVAVQRGELFKTFKEARDHLVDHFECKAYEEKSGHYGSTRKRRELKELNSELRYIRAIKKPRAPRGGPKKK